MTSSTRVLQLPKEWRAVAVLCLLLAAYHLWALPRAWHEWASGRPDAYAGQHRGLLLSHVGGLALALVIPLPGLLGLTRTRRQRIALWGLWGTLMAVTVASLALRLV